MNLPGIDKVTYHEKCPSQENSWEDDPLDGFDKVAYSARVESSNLI